MGYNTVRLDKLLIELAAKYDNAPFWTDIEGTLALNEGLRIWNMLTGMWRTRQLVPTYPNQAWVSVPAGITFGMRMAWNGLPLTRSSRLDLGNGRPNWQGETSAMAGAVAGVPGRPWTWAPFGLTLLAIWPADAFGAGQLVVDGVAKTPQLVNLADTVDLNEAEHSALLYYALHYLLFKEGGDRFKVSLEYFREFIAAAARCNYRIRATSLYRKAMGIDLARGSRPMEIQVGAQYKRPKQASDRTGENQGGETS